jgi:peptidoglycan hydrolase CwlO-like protein
MSVTNLTPEELKVLQEYQNENNEIVAGLGTIELTIDNLNSQKTELLEKFKKLQTQQSKTAKELQAKYGDGNINLETGEISALE